MVASLRPAEWDAGDRAEFHGPRP